MVKALGHSTRLGVLLLAAVTAIALAATEPAAPAGTSTAQPALRILDTMPLTLRGLRFRPLEKVKVTATTRSGVTVVTVRATRQGTFAARFPRVVVTRCLDELAVKAVGARGSRAGVTLSQPQCDPGGSATPATR